MSDTSDTSDAVREAEELVAGGPGRMVTGLIERIGGMASADAVFGKPVEREGLTVIPVASVRWGGGAGGGSGKEAGKEGEGGGGGGGAAAKPVGYIEMSGGEARFVRIRDISALGPIIV
ncbi:MAG: spore germination protein GerW family protein, partial [Dehalococcoidia bacterium]